VRAGDVPPGGHSATGRVGLAGTAPRRREQRAVTNDGRTT